MIVIRLQRTGKRNDPTYRIVAAQKTAAVQGKFLQVVGYYLPTRQPAELKFDADTIQKWISNGAQPTTTVARLLKKEGMKDLDKFIKGYAKQRPKKEPPPPPPPPPPPKVEVAPPAAPVEAPKQEAQVEAEKPAEAPVVVEEKATQEPVVVEEKAEENTAS